MCSTISIHALLAESDPTAARNNKHNVNFYPRSPCGERLLHVRLVVECLNISIHALLAESDRARRPGQTAKAISIHALLAESDAAWKEAAKESWNFYPRSPCGERRRNRKNTSKGHQISIHALLAESDIISQMAIQAIHISIHALLAESDLAGMSEKLIGTVFLSTLSLRRATINAASHTNLLGKFLSTLSLRRATGFSRPLRAAKHQFLSTLSLRRATRRNSQNIKRRHISIHALLAESDVVETQEPKPTRQFLSTLSLRRATRKPSIHV